MKLTKSYQIENFLIKENANILLEDVSKDYIDRVHSDILIFLKNVNRLKNADDFFELLDYWIYWRNEEFTTFEKKISGKGLHDKSHHDDSITGKIINRLEKSITGLFYVDEQDLRKYLKKQLDGGAYAHVDNYVFENVNNIINFCLENNRSFSAFIKERLSNDDTYFQFYQAKYFTVWSSNANSRYISTKKIVDEVFEELNSYFIEDQFVEEAIVRENVRIYLSYAESQIDILYDTLKKVESALSFFSRKDWGKKVLPDMEMAIDFVNPRTNYTFKTSYGLSKNAGCYVTTDDIVVIAKQYVETNYIFEILAHEIGHRFYYQIMNKVGREDWEALYNSFKEGSNMTEYKKALMYFTDNLNSMKEDYKKNLRNKNTNYSSLIKDFGSIYGYLSLINEIYFKNKHGTILTDFIYQYSDKGFKYGFDLDIYYIVTTSKVEGDARRSKTSITSDYEGYELLTPATMEAINQKVIDLFRESVEAEEKTFIQNFPTRYAGENASELFAETFTANAIKNLNIVPEKEYKVSEYIYNTFRHITGIRESIKKSKKI